MSQDGTVNLTKPCRKIPYRPQVRLERLLQFRAISHLRVPAFFGILMMACRGVAGETGWRLDRELRQISAVARAT